MISEANHFLQFLSKLTPAGKNNSKSATNYIPSIRDVHRAPAVVNLENRSKIGRLMMGFHLSIQKHTRKTML